MKKPVQRRLAATAALILCLTQPLAAQVPADRDLEALRFYLSQRDEAATNAELQRLRSAFPNWTPPSDLGTLLQQQPSTEIDEIYRLIARGDTAGAQAAIERTQAAYSSWTPPAEMRDLLQLTEAQQRFDQAVAQNRPREAIEVARNNPPLLRCDRVNNAWNLAEMQQAVQEAGAAVLTYRGVLSSCNTFSEIVATLEKASAVASPAEMEEFFAIATRRFPANGSALTELRSRLLGGAAPVAQAPAAPPATRTPAAPPAQAPAASAPQRQAAATATAPAPAPAAPPAPVAGRLPARGDARLQQTRNAASAGNWAACLAYSTNPRSAELMYERAWCAYNLDRPLEALAGFRVAERAGLGATVTRDARFGMALALLNNQMTEEAARIAAATDLTPEQRLDVESIILDQRGVRAYQSRDYRSAINFLDALEQIRGSLRRDLAILRAYAYLNLGQRREAEAQFQTLHNQLATPETRAGLRASAAY